MGYSMADRPVVEPTSFSNLPYELRRQIWILTFQPRLLCLHAHQHASAPSFDGKGPRGDAYRRITVAFTFIATEGPPSCAFEEYDNHKAKTAVEIGETTGEEHRECGRLPLLRSTPGPVALHVCAESRQMALERYQLAFPSTRMDINDEYLNQYWNISTHEALVWGSDDFYKYSTGEEGTWIDFQRDIVMIDRAWRPRSPDLRHFMKSPLNLLALFAEKDAQMLVKLAVSGNGDLGLSFHENARSFIRELHMFFQPRISHFAFSSVKELILDDTYGSAPGHDSTTRINERTRMKNAILSRIEGAICRSPRAAQRGVVPEIKFLKE